jgi:hypothetical protein
MICKFSRRARHYILAYFWAEHEQEDKIKEEERFINHCFQKSQEKKMQAAMQQRSHQQQLQDKTQVKHYKTYSRIIKIAAHLVAECDGSCNYLILV